MTRTWYLLILPFIFLNLFVLPARAEFSSCLGGQVSLDGDLGGQVSLDGGIHSLVQCVQNDNPPLVPINNGGNEGVATYIYVLTNNSANIITSFSSSSTIDMDVYGIGTYRIYGFSYTGVLNQSTLQPGLPFMGISSNDCFSYSTNYITISRNSCEAENCQGGNIFTSEGDTYISPKVIPI